MKLREILLAIALAGGAGSMIGCDGPKEGPTVAPEAQADSDKRKNSMEEYSKQLKAQKGAKKAASAPTK